MALTADCDVYLAVQDAGIDRLVRHFFRQRPSLVNYASAGLARQQGELCRPIDAHPVVAARGNPLVTVLPPLPVALTEGQFAVDYSLQVTAAEVDVHPGDVITLPPQLSPPLAEQRMAVHGGVCLGFGCPPQEIVDRLSASVGPVDRPPREPAVLPYQQLLCTCVDFFAVLGAKFSGVPGAQHIVGRLDGLELVDLGPTELEDTLECYLTLVAKLGVLPQVRSRLLSIPPLRIGELLTLDVAPTPSSDALPNNPALEEDQIKVFLDVATGPGTTNPPTPPGPPGPAVPPRGGPRGRVRTGAFDATVALSEKAIHNLFAAVLANFRLQKSDSKDFGPFSLSYDVDAHLENGTLDLRDDGTIRLSELDLAFSTLRACLGIDIPEICLGGFCIIPNPFGGCILRAPRICAFTANPDINVCLDIAPFVRSELSATVRPVVTYSLNPGRTPAMNDWDAFDAHVQNAWQVYADPSAVDIDLFDIADIVGGLLDSALNAALDTLLGPLPGWFKDLVRAILGPVINVVRDVLDFGDDFNEWLADKLGFDLSLFDVVTNLVIAYLAKSKPLVNVFEPVGTDDGSGLVPVLIPIEYLSLDVTGDELVLGADIGA